MNDIEAKLERTRSELRNSESDMGQRLLERSRNEINSAKEAFNGGDVQRAMFHLRRANRYLGEAAEIVSP